MTRRRLRPAWPPEELARIYATPHDHTRWDDHRLRVAVTVEVGRWMTRRGDVHTVADLSCGDAAVATRLGADATVLGDYAPGYPVTGPLEETLPALDAVDLYVCAETLEHLDDPDAALRTIRDRSRLLLASTPVNAWADVNPEHYWCWDRQGVEDMLAAAGWVVDAYVPVDLRPAGYYYAFGVWACR